MLKVIGYKVLILFILVMNISANTGDNNYWYKCLKGQIGKYPVTMHLVKYDKNITGYYYYDKFLQPISVLGDIKGDSVSLLTSMNGPINEMFNGTLKNDVYKGTWENNNDSSSNNFSLTVDESLSSMFEYVYVHEMKQLFKGWRKTPEVEYSESSVWPADEYPNAQFIRKMICREKKFPESSEEIGGRMIKNKNKFINDYFEENKSLTKKEIEDIGYGSMYSLTDDDNLVIAYSDNKLFVISRLYYSYTGGAHGNYGTSYSVFDLVNKRKLALTDIITDEGIKNMPRILENNFRKQNAVKENETLSDYGLFVDTIPVNDNFLFTPGGLAFDYVPYEISPYAAGEIIIFISISDIEAFLKPEIKKLL